VSGFYEHRVCPPRRSHRGDMLRNAGGFRAGPDALKWVASPRTGVLD
jgi:hypothetical protein